MHACKSRKYAKHFWAGTFEGFKAQDFFRGKSNLRRHEAISKLLSVTGNCSSTRAAQDFFFILSCWIFWGGGGRRRGKREYVTLSRKPLKNRKVWVLKTIAHNSPNFQGLKSASQRQKGLSPLRLSVKRWVRYGNCLTIGNRLASVNGH